MNSQTSIPLPHTHTQNLAILAALLTMDSLHFVFARLLLPLISPQVSVMYVMAIATVVVGAYALATRQINFGVLRKHLLFFVVIGFLILAGNTLRQRM